MNKAYLLVICLLLTTLTGCIEDSNLEEINEDSNLEEIIEDVIDDIEVGSNESLLYAQTYVDNNAQKEDMPGTFDLVSTFNLELVGNNVTGGLGGADPANCEINWPSDNYHIAVYAFVSEYVLNEGGSVGCYFDSNLDKTYSETVTLEMEDAWRLVIGDGDTSETGNEDSANDTNVTIDETNNTVEDTWGQLTTNLPEIYYTSDVPQSQIDTLMSAYNTSSGAWGNYGPLEFWIVGTDWDAAYELDKQYCSVRAEKDSSITSDDEQYCLERSHNMTSYVENGGAGLGLYRSYHEDYSVFVLTFASKYPYPDETDYTAVAYHEYFHVYQQAHIFTKDHDERQELSGGNPYWGEGGAEYMAQLLYSRQDGVDSNYLKDRMTWKMEAKNNLEDGESIANITYGQRAHIAYDLGSWYVAYIINQTSEDAYLNGFYDDLNELGWEGSFVKNFGVSSEQMLSNFNDFLDLTIEEQLEIIP